MIIIFLKYTQYKGHVITYYENFHPIEFYDIQLVHIPTIKSMGNYMNYMSLPYLNDFIFMHRR